MATRTGIFRFSEDDMAKYLISFSYTLEAWAKMIQKPTDRSAATRAVLEPVGGVLECFYFTFGERDGFVIVEVPDSDAAAAAAIAVASTGSFRAVTSQELIDPQRMIDVLGKAGRGVAVYPTPGS
jgi:uncharacterized protein with GYD domain